MPKLVKAKKKIGKKAMKLRKRTGPARHPYYLRSKSRPPKPPPRVAVHPPCVICLDTSPSKQVRKVKCGHVYHVRCINSWLKMADSCPLCRHQLRPPCLVPRIMLRVPMLHYLFY